MKPQNGARVKKRDSLRIFDIHFNAVHTISGIVLGIGKLRSVSRSSYSRLDTFRYMYKSPSLVNSTLVTSNYMNVTNAK